MQSHVVWGCLVPEPQWQPCSPVHIISVLATEGGGCEDDERRRRADCRLEAGQCWAQRSPCPPPSVSVLCCQQQGSLCLPASLLRFFCQRAQQARAPCSPACAVCPPVFLPPPFPGVGRNSVVTDKALGCAWAVVGDRLLLRKVAPHWERGHFQAPVGG